jgi:CubicO group peptidase (beta-lactamase class C family)
MVMFKKLIYWGIVAALCFTLSELPCFAQGTSGSSGQLPLPLPSQKPGETNQVAPPQPTRQGLSDPQELEAFLEKFLPEEMQKAHVPGAVVTVVKDGTLFFSRGYGYANIDDKTPVVPDQTLFRVASLSKLFTDTAVMQLYERGSLNLHEDVNHYLQDFQIENHYSKPVTAAHLMTQTDGTSQRLLGIAAPTATQMTPLASFIPDRMPPFIFPPGKFYSYSNMSITLAGYLVESITKTPFVQYVEQNILQPLGMQRSTFQQPLPSQLATDLAIGYRYKNNKYQPYPFLYFNIAPAAALSATATDMAHFMIAHLQNGQYKNSRILQEETAQLMHRQHFAHHPKLPGTAYGFHERLENNIRAIGHLGNMPGYSSSLTLLPDQNLGIFIASNSYAPGLPGTLVSQFLNHYFPVVQTPTPSSPTKSSDRIQRFAGTYRDLEYPRDTLAKLTAPFGHLHIKAEDDRTLTVETPGLFFPTKVVQRRLVPVEPLLFYRTDDDNYTAFGKNNQGQITYVFNPFGEKISTFEKIPWYETIVFQFWLAVFCIVLFLSACFILPISHWLGRSSKQKTPTRITRFAFWNAGLAGGLYLFFLVGSGLALWLIGAWKLAYGIPAIVNAFLYLPPIATGLTIGLLFFTVLAWRNQYWSRSTRIYYSLITLAALIFIPLQLYWNLLGTQF